MEVPKVSCWNREYWYQSSCRPLKTRHPLLEDQACRTWILKDHYTRPNLRTLSDHDLKIVAKSFDIPTRLYVRDYVIEEIFRRSTYRDLVEVTQETRLHLNERLRQCANARQTYFEQCDGKEGFYEDSGHKQARSILNNYLKSCERALENYESMIQRFDDEYDEFVRDNNNLIRRIQDAEKLEDDSKESAVGLSDDEVFLVEISEDADAEDEEEKNEAMKDMQIKFDRALERKRRREEKSKRLLAIEKESKRVLEKLRNEEKEEEYRRATQCFEMANHARMFISNVKDVQGIYKIKNEWLVKFMEILKQSQNGVTEETYKKFNQFSRMMALQLRYIPFVMTMDDGSIKQVATILLKLANFKNSAYWASFPQHIVAFNLNNPETEDWARTEGSEMGFPALSDDVTYSLFSKFVSVWPIGVKKVEEGQAFIAILHSMLSVDTFIDYVKEKIAQNREEMSAAKTSDEKKQVMKRHDARMEFVSKLAFFPSSRVMFVRYYLTDVLKNCGNVPYACRFMIDIVKRTTKFIADIQKNARLAINTDGQKHHFTLTKNLSSEVAEFKKVAKEVELKCANELKAFDELMEQ